MHLCILGVWKLQGLHPAHAFPKGIPQVRHCHGHVLTSPAYGFHDVTASGHIEGPRFNQESPKFHIWLVEGSSFKLNSDSWSPLQATGPQRD